MSERPTPETDAFAIKFKTTCGEKYWVPVDIARKLERERDEAREHIERQRLEIVRLNGATNHAGGTPLKIALRERDEWAEMCGRYKQERDEAMEQAQQMSESNQVLMADVRFYRNAWEQLKEGAK